MQAVLQQVHVSSGLMIHRDRVVKKMAVEIKEYVGHKPVKKEEQLENKIKMTQKKNKKENKRNAKS